MLPSKSFPRQKRWRSGQDLVEYALLVPFTLLAILVLIDLGRVVFVYSVLSNASREAARYASVRDDTAGADIQAYVLERIPSLEAADLTFNASWTNCSKIFLPDGITQVSQPGKVTIQLDYVVDTMLLGNNVPTSSTATMKLESCP
jgi:Flp pilus assembly protein TadG